MDSSPSLTVLNRWHKREIVFSHRWRVYCHNVKCVLVTQNKYHVFLQRNKDDHLSQLKKHPLYSILKINNIVDHSFATIVLLPITRFVLAYNTQCVNAGIINVYISCTVRWCLSEKYIIWQYILNMQYKEGICFSVICQQHYSKKCTFRDCSRSHVKNNNQSSTSFALSIQIGWYMI